MLYLFSFANEAIEGHLFSGCSSLSSAAFDSASRSFGVEFCPFLGVAWHKFISLIPARPLANTALLFAAHLRRLRSIEVRHSADAAQVCWLAAHSDMPILVNHPRFTLDISLIDDESSAKQTSASFWSGANSSSCKSLRRSSSQDDSIRSPLPSIFVSCLNCPTNDRPEIDLGNDRRGNQPT
jgi:hypothetical protein